GYTGLMAALELRRFGHSVVLLEAKRIGHGASGRNGGQIAIGYSPGMCETADIVGLDAARELWQLSIEATGILKDVIRRHDIDCDLREGEYYAAVKPRHRDWLHR